MESDRLYQLCLERLFVKRSIPPPNYMQLDQITEHKKLYAVGWKLHCLHVRSHLQPIFINAHQTRMYKYYPLSRGVTSIIEQKDPMCFSLNFCGMNDCQCVDILKIGGLDADIDELVIFCSFVCSSTNL